MFTCSRHTAVTTREETWTSGRTVSRGPDESICRRTVPWDAHELQRRVFVLTAPCLHYPCGDTAVRTNCYPRSGRKSLLSSPCRRSRRSCQGRYQLRHGIGRSGRTMSRGPDESICRRHRAVGCARVARACICAYGNLPSPSVRRHGGPDELFAEVRTKVFDDGTVPWDAPELPRRVHVLAATCRHHP